MDKTTDETTNGIVWWIIGVFLGVILTVFVGIFFVRIEKRDAIKTFSEDKMVAVCMAEKNSLLECADLYVKTKWGENQ